MFGGEIEFDAQIFVNLAYLLCPCTLWFNRNYLYKSRETQPVNIVNSMMNHEVQKLQKKSNSGAFYKK